MVQIYEQTHFYDHDWQTVTLAYFLRYPNPFARHVVSADVVDRNIGGDGRLYTTRLLLKKGKIPAWSTRFLGNIGESYIVETSVVDREKMEMETITRNLDHTKIMTVKETQTYRSGRGAGDVTEVTTRAEIISQLGWGLTNQIEGFGYKKFRENIMKSRQGMAFILERLPRYRFVHH